MSNYVSTASLVVGVAAVHSKASDILVAGAMSMASGAYVSVTSQSDTERADLDLERRELATESNSEHNELAAKYDSRWVEPSLTRQVAEQLMAQDTLAAHAHTRDEFEISDMTTARTVQAALVSAGTFAIGASLPLVTVVAIPPISF
ncbi:MAG TPA: hypothetical protein DIW81_12510 [Planctomycetaceae bacterium]|nr:hypothetical protein [Planctomycetaceae bacterium]